MKDPRGVIEILNVLTGIENINEEDNLVNDLGIDSLNMVELMLSIEEYFEIMLDASDLNPFDLNTVADVISLVEKYRFRRSDSCGEKDS